MGAGTTPSTTTDDFQHFESATTGNSAHCSRAVFYLLTACFCCLLLFAIVCFACLRLVALLACCVFVRLLSKETKTSKQGKQGKKPSEQKLTKQSKQKQTKSSKQRKPKTNKANKARKPAKQKQMDIQSWGTILEKSKHRSIQNALAHDNVNMNFTVLLTTTFFKCCMGVIPILLLPGAFHRIETVY